MADLETIEAIKRLKYRYLRALDTKHWDDFADTLTADIVGDYEVVDGEDLALHQPRRVGAVHADRDAGRGHHRAPGRPPGDRPSTTATERKAPGTCRTA